VCSSDLWSNYLLRWDTGPIVLVLMIIIPIVSYFVVKIWMEEEVSDYPDIDKAWKQGLTALEKHGISLGSTPLFLVIGNADERRAQNIMDASGFGFNVNNPAEGPAALHWYANPDGVFLYLTRTSCMSVLADQFQNQTGGRSQVQSAAPQPEIPGGQTIVAGAGQQSLVADKFTDDEETAGSDDAEMSYMEPPPSMPGIGQTMDFGQGGGVDATLSNISVDQMKEGLARSSSVQQSKADLTDQIKRLEYVCGMIHKVRQPICPINGILVLVPFDMVEDASDPVQTAIHTDLETIRSKTRLRCSVTALVTEMDQSQGFLELIRRVGSKRAKEQRFGKGFPLWNPPIAEQLEAVSRHATGAFEDWTYLLFREKEGLRRPGNPKLFELLCRIRGKFADSITNIIANSFGYEPHKNRQAAGNSLLFSGCYFAATGDTEDRQAFVRSVLYRVMQQDSELDWNREALDENNSAEFAANLAALVGGICFVVLVGVGLDYAFHDYLPWNKE